MVHLSLTVCVSWKFSYFYTGCHCKIRNWWIYFTPTMIDWFDRITRMTLTNFFLLFALLAVSMVQAATIRYNLKSIVLWYRISTPLSNWFIRKFCLFKGFAVVISALLVKLYFKITLFNQSQKIHLTSSLGLPARPNRTKVQRIRSGGAILTRLLSMKYLVRWEV